MCQRNGEQGRKIERKTNVNETLQGSEKRIKNETKIERDRQKSKKKKKKKKKVSREKLMEKYVHATNRTRTKRCTNNITRYAVPHALRPYDTVILHLNTNNVCFYSAFDFRTRMYERAV